MTHITDERPADSSPTVPSDTEQLAREQAIKQIERKRRYWISSAISFVGVLIVAVIWAIGEYHNAGGWPTQGFSQSSGSKHSPHVLGVISMARVFRRGYGDSAAGAGGRHGVPVNRPRRTVRVSWPCLRAVSM